MNTKMRLLVSGFLLTSSGLMAVEKSVVEKTAEKNKKMWDASIDKEMAKSKSFSMPDSATTENLVVKVEDLYQEVFGANLSWPNVQRKGGQALGLLLKLSLAYAMTVASCELTGRLTGRHVRVLRFLITIAAYKLSCIAVDRAAAFVSWDPRCVAFANKILQSIDSGKVLVSEQPAVQNIADNALAASGRSTSLVKVGQRMTKEQKVEMAKKLQEEIERSSN